MYDLNVCKNIRIVHNVVHCDILMCRGHTVIIMWYCDSYTVANETLHKKWQDKTSCISQHFNRSGAKISDMWNVFKRFLNVALKKSWSQGTETIVCNGLLSLSVKTGCGLTHLNSCQMLRIALLPAHRVSSTLRTMYVLFWTNVTCKQSSWWAFTVWVSVQESMIMYVILQSTASVQFQLTNLWLVIFTNNT